MEMTIPQNSEMEALKTRVSELEGLVRRYEEAAKASHEEAKKSRKQLNDTTEKLKLQEQKTVESIRIMEIMKGELKLYR